MDISLIVQGAAALLLVLALIILIAWVLKRHFGGTPRQGQPALRRRNRRLGIVEAAPIGTRHRLVLVRRDDVEHLLLIGGATELVVEGSIPRDTEAAEVNIRAVEPRFDEDLGSPLADRRDIRAEPRATAGGGGYSHDPYERSGFERPFGAHHEEEDRDEPELSGLGYGEDREETDRERGFGRGERDYFSADRPGFHRPEPSPFGRSERSSLYTEREPSPYRTDETLLRPTIDEDSDSEIEERDRRLPRDDEDRGAEQQDDEASSAQSRILNRFLKRDES